MSLETVVVRFEPGGQEVEARVGETLLEVARRAGRLVGTACDGDGICARCGLRVLAGAPGALSEETADERRVKRANKVGQLRLSCQARVLGPVTVTATYW